MKTHKIMDGNFWQMFFCNILWAIYALSVTISVVLHKSIINAAKNCFTQMSLCKYFFALFLTCISILLTPALLFLIFILWGYKRCISLVLKLKYGKKFGGMLDGSGTFFCANPKSNSLVHVLLIIDYDGKSNDFYNFMKKYVKNKLLVTSRRWPELTCVRQKYLGYFFNLKDEYGIDELVQRWNFEGSDEKIDENTFQKSMNAIGSRALPKNNNVYWEILVGNKPVQWKNNVTKQYPLLINIHHSLASGSCMVQFFNCFLFCENNNSNHEKTELKSNIFQILAESFLSFIYYFVILLLCILICPFNYFLKETDENILYGKVLSGERLLVWKSEDTEEYIPKIKEIKKKLPGTAFVQVLLSATATSLHSYVNGGSLKNHNKIYATMAADLKLPSKEKFSQDHIELTAKHLSIIPFYLSGSFVSAKKNLDLIKERVEILKSSLLIQANNILIQGFGIFPSFVVEYWNTMYGSTLVFSNLPHPLKALTIDNKYKLNDHIVWTVISKKIGISLLIITYENKLKVALMVDKAIISSEDEAKKLIDGIFEYIDSLHKEVCF